MTTTVMARPVTPAPLLLYMPIGTAGTFAWEVHHDGLRLGAFPDQDACFRHALMLAASMGSRRHRDVVLKIENDDGSWTTVTAYQSKQSTPHI